MNCILKQIEMCQDVSLIVAIGLGVCFSSYVSHCVFVALCFLQGFLCIRRSLYVFLDEQRKHITSCTKKLYNHI